MKKKIDLMKNFRQIKFITDHTMSETQKHQMIRDKLERAERQSIALKAYLAAIRKNIAEDRV